MLLSVTGPDPDGAGPLGRPVTGYRYDETKVGTVSAVGPALQGLQGAYYANASLAGRPAARQTDATVGFAWGTGGPAALPGVTDSFSVRWTGNLVVEAEGDYSFATFADEGTRLTVDGVEAIANWKDQTATAVSSQPLHLSVGLHPVVLEYYEKTGPAQVELRWSCSACTPAVPEQVVPAASLRPAWLNLTSVVSPAGRVAFSHFADPAGGLPDYSLVVLADATNVITGYAYDDTGRLTQTVMPKGNALRTIDQNGNLQGVPDTTY